MWYTLEKKMTFGLLQKYNKFLGTVAISAILSVGVLSTIHFGMGSMSSDGMTDNCPFAGVTYSMCEQGAVWHLSAWRGLLATIPLGASTILVVLLASIFLIYFPLLFLWKFHPIPILRPRIASYDLAIPPPPLKEAFSQGILNPKLF